MAASTTTTFPVLANADNVLFVQPLSQEYDARARAVASALLYRYTGVNTGFGCTQDGSTQPLKDQPTPLHVLQVLLAEWLYVYAGLADKKDAASVLSMTKAHGLPEPYTGTDLPREVIQAQSGRHVPSFTSLLGYCADWIGTVAPSYVSISSGDLGKTVRGYIGNALRILPSRLPVRSPVHDAYVSGKALPSDVFIHSLNTMLQSEEHTLHGTKIVVAKAVSHTLTHVRVRAFSRKQQHSVCNPMDLALVCPPEYSASVPAEIQLPTKDVSDALAGVSVVVCVLVDGDHDWFPVFPGALTDAVLQKVVVRAMADTLVEAISVKTKTPGYAELREVTGKALLLNVLSNTSADFIKASVQEAFEAAFPQSSASEAPTSPTTPPAPYAFIPHHKLSLVTLYFTPDNFQAVVPDLKVLQNFLEDVKLMKDSASGALWLTDERDKRGNVVAKVTESADPSHKFRVDKATGVSLKGMVDILGSPMLSVTFMREDLLSIALSGKKSQQTFSRLWALHQKGIVGHYFDDELSDAIAEHVIDGKTLQFADAWSRGVLMQIVFSPEDAVRAGELLDSLYEDLRLFAFVYKDETLLTQQKPAKGFIVPEATLEKLQTDDSDSDSDEANVLDIQELAMYALEEPSHLPSRIPLRDLTSIVSPFVRGICVTTAQIAVIRGVGNEQQKSSLQALLRGAQDKDNSKSITSTQLARCMQEDLETISHVQ